MSNAFARSAAPASASLGASGAIRRLVRTDPTGAFEEPRLLDQRTRTRTEGFLISDYEQMYDYVTDRLARWIREDELVYRETISEGIETAPEAFLGLFEGENIGKQLVRVGDPDA